MHSSLMGYNRVNDLRVGDNTWVNPDSVNNIGMYSNPFVLCLRYGLQVSFIHVTTFHVEVKLRVGVVQNNYWVSCYIFNVNLLRTFKENWLGFSLFKRFIFKFSSVLTLSSVMIVLIFNVRFTKIG